MSVASLDDHVVPDYRNWVGVLFAVHQKVEVRGMDGQPGPEFCTCGDVWPCRSEATAARLLDFESSGTAEG